MVKAVAMRRQYRDHLIISGVPENNRQKSPPVNKIRSRHVRHA